jgi:tight adherence protein B
VINISNRDIFYAVGLSAVFMCVLLSFSFLYSYVIAPMRHRRSLRQRVDKVKRVTSHQTEIIKVQKFKGQMIFKFFERFGAKARIEELQRQLQQADVTWDATTFLGVMVLLALLGFIFGNLKQGLPAGLAFAFLLGMVPLLVVKAKKQKKSTLIEQQMPEVMDLLSRSLRAGHTLPSAFELAGRETPHPLGTELSIVYEEQRLGIGLNGALQDMVKRVDSHNLRYFVTGVLIQSETGGSLAELMEKISNLIRDRLKLRLKVQSLTAEGRASAVMLCALPIVLFLFLYLSRPQYIMVLFSDPLGKKLLIGALASMFLGILWIRKIIQIKI